ncbi:hypothetical protein BS50DRAFT_108727 [Corynespora cassiicola Philippines]|uniref:Zn(2)-C6 fungal-type domain-containing protein n=1 Tax=Corynespora cassiicola Philippines TaxID=1448308 RepID=A0A2T2NCV8_CORCC|nr:hypothetical protein BS50DRAFT_108727 [Corynespora cassiicola Philippines]
MRVDATLFDRFVAHSPQLLVSNSTSIPSVPFRKLLAQWDTCRKLQDGMIARRRACDRCAELVGHAFECSWAFVNLSDVLQKAQCAEEPPCGRCQRLGLQCTHDRPILPRGRPRKNTRRASKESVSPTNRSNGSGRAVARLAASPKSIFQSSMLPMDSSLTTELWEYIFASTDQIGILSALRRVDHKALIKHTQNTQNEILTSAPLQCALLSCGLLFRPPREGIDVQTMLEKLRNCALSEIPVISWDPQPIPAGDIYCLYIFANLGYLQHGLAHLADRWGTLAKSLACTERLRVQDLQGDAIEIERRLNSLLDLNSSVQSLLYNRPCNSRPNYDSTSAIIPHELFEAIESSQDSCQENIPQTSDSIWHRSSSPQAEEAMNEDESIGLGEGFFDLFLPLRDPLESALCFPALNSIKYRATMLNLEDYFISFPTHLMEFIHVRSPWQFESMIWFHGIHILLDAGADLLEIVFNSAFHRSQACTSAADNSILLGDVLKALANFPTALSRLNHATIFFIALSATVHSSILRQLYLEQKAAPHVLLESAKAHEMTLELILQVNPTCDHPVIQAAKSVVTAHLEWFSQAPTPETCPLADYFEEMKYYRWVSRGRGITKLDEETAAQLFQATLQKYDETPMVSNLPQDILSVFDPEARINQPGTFDLKILFR